MAGKRWLGAHHAATPLEALDQRGFLATDIGTGTDAQLDVESAPAARDIRAQPAIGTRQIQRLAQHLGRARVLHAQPDIAPGGPHRESRDDHAFDQLERIGFHQQTIGEGARIALLGIAHDVLLRWTAHRARSAT